MLAYFVVATVTKQKGFMTMISFRYYWLTVFVSKRLAGIKERKSYKMVMKNDRFGFYYYFVYYFYFLQPNTHKC
jgi:hypothetical protein